MRRLMPRLALLSALAFLAYGCGVADDDFQAGNRMTLTKIADTSGSTAPIFYAGEETDDSGADGQPGTDDPGENNGKPDNGEAILTKLSDDIGVLSLDNEPRLGVDPGVELRVYHVDVTYVDANGNSRDFAPTFRQDLNVSIPSGSSADVQIVLVPLQMKIVQGGLRDLIVFGTEAEREAASTMTAFVDVYARDDRNNDSVLATGKVTLKFINPIVFEKTQ